MGSEALELALAVYRTPIKRHALYDMVLPHDIGLVLQLASAPQPLLSEVAAEVDESEDTVVEASRFYLQLALFQPEADAYRILGLAADATHERIREHYRWLQRWVHPDRRGEDWVALFATRVNWAWSNLRNETVRRAYDDECDLDTSTQPDETAGQEVRRTTEWNTAVAHTHRASRVGQLVFGALLCSCIALLYMALTRDDGVPQYEAGTRSLEAARKDSRTTTPSALPATSSGSYASMPAVPAAPVPEASVTDRDTHESTPIVAAGSRANSPDETSRLADPRKIERVAPASASRAATVQNDVEAPKLPAPAAIQSGSGVPDEADAAREAGKSVVAERKSKIVEQAKATADTSSGNAIDHDKPAATASKAAAQTAGIASLADSKSNSAPPSLQATNPTAIEQSSTATRRVPGDANTTVRGGPRTGSTEEVLARIDLAHQRVKELSTFFSRFDSRLPPIWNDLAGQASAEAQRIALHERAGSRDPADFVVDDARWRMSEDSAALTANYHLLKRNAVSESGHISLSMVWRERMWLVAQVELRPTL